MKRLWLSALILTLAAAPSAAEVVKGSREYVRLQKELRNEKKELMQDRQEVAEFSSLLREMETVDPAESKRYYWRLNAQARAVMDREYNQTSGRAAVQRKEKPPTQSASVPGALEALEVPREGLPSPTLSNTRANRMKMILRESDGLQHAMANGDSDTRARYHHLLAEFLGLMRAEVDDVTEDIAEREALLN